MTKTWTENSIKERALRIIVKSAIVLSLIFVLGSVFGAQANAATKAWSKNSKGQFVNDKGEVIKGATMKGVDVSRWQGNINWAKVAKTDVDFAIIRCGYGDNITSQDDAYWEKNIQGCIDNNIPFSTYLYSYALNAAQAKSEADHVLRLLAGREVNFPVYYDMEDNTQAKLGKTKVGQLATIFMNAVNGQGYKSGVYANLNWWTYYIPKTISNNASIFKWVARYNSYLGYKGSYNMWQCTSKGKVNGITGDVDINFWFGEYNPEWFKKQMVVTASAPVVRPAKTKITSIKKGHKKLTIKWKKIKGAVGYKVRYSKYKSMKKYKTRFAKGTKITIKKLKRRTRYYVMVRTFVTNTDGKRLFSKKWSKMKSKKTKKW